MSTHDYEARTAASNKIGTVSKAIVAQLTSILVLIGGLGAFTGFLPGPVGVTLASIATVATGILTYLKRNTPTVQQVIDDGAQLGLEIKNRF